MAWSTHRNVAAGDQVIIWLVRPPSLLPFCPTHSLNPPQRPETSFCRSSSLLEKSSTAGLVSTHTPTLSASPMAPRSARAMEGASYTSFAPLLSSGPWLCPTALKSSTSPTSPLLSLISTSNQPAQSSKQVSLSSAPLKNLHHDTKDLHDQARFVLPESDSCSNLSILPPLSAADLIR